jgi:hypothetical protein
MTMINAPNELPVLNPLAVNREDRMKAPAHVWDWQAFETWRGVIWELLGDLVNSRVKRAFVRSPPKYVVGDDLSWLNKIILSVRGIDVDTKVFLTERLIDRFQALRAVHGTRISDPSSFYRHGLLPLDPEVFHEHARTVFLNDDFPEITEAELKNAILAVGGQLREGRVWFEGNENLLVEQCGHYMLYGSEYLIAIAANLGQRRDYRQALKATGKPTLFVCDVPLHFISGYTLQEFAGTALEMVFQELLDGHKFSPDRWRGAGFCIHKALPPSCLVGHCHPVVRRDPFGLGT